MSSGAKLITFSKLIKSVWASARN